jgi:hypothetical protein
MTRNHAMGDDDAEYHDAMCAASKVLVLWYDFDRSEYANEPI